MVALQLGSLDPVVEDMIDGSLHEPKANFFKALNDIISTEEALSFKLLLVCVRWTLT